MAKIGTSYPDVPDIFDQSPEYIGLRFQLYPSRISEIFDRKLSSELSDRLIVHFLTALQKHSSLPSFVFDRRYGLDQGKLKIASVFFKSEEGNKLDFPCSPELIRGGLTPLRYSIEGWIRFGEKTNTHDQSGISEQNKVVYTALYDFVVKHKYLTPHGFVFF